LSIKLGMIGGGVMGEAILSRLLELRIYQPDQVIVSEPNDARRSFLKETYQVGVTGDNQQVMLASEVVLLAIKPQIFDLVVENLQGNHGLESSLIVSILAGVPLKRLEKAFPGKPVIRSMPNTPATVGAGVTAISLGKEVKSDHFQLAKKILEAIGEVVEISETMMDAVTGLSGSGPAYVAIAIEALADGGVAAGLPRAIAHQLALETVLGTAQLIKDTNLHPAQLKDRVTSPGGTTIAGVSQLESHGFRSALIEAVKAASQRSRELSD
jgi:pyrroline-5-carboxylate reductase